jgi:hypothetical protein
MFRRIHKSKLDAENAKPSGDWVFMIALIILGALVVILWVLDPSHRPTGESRVHWPAPAAKP